MSDNQTPTVAESTETTAAPPAETPLAAAVREAMSLDLKALASIASDTSVSEETRTAMLRAGILSEKPAILARTEKVRSDKEAEVRKAAVEFDSAIADLATETGRTWKSAINVADYLVAGFGLNPAPAKVIVERHPGNGERTVATPGKYRFPHGFEATIGDGGYRTFSAAAIAAWKSVNPDKGEPRPAQVAGYMKAKVKIG